MNWMLICVIALLAICLYHGYRQGLVRMLFSIVTFFVTIVLVRLLAPVGIQMLKNTDAVYDGVKAPVVRFLDEHVDGKQETQEVLDTCQIPESIKSTIMELAEKMDMNQVTLFTPEMRDITADCITLWIIDLLAYVLMFIIINIALRIVGKLLNVFSRLPVVRVMNRLGGCLFGALEGVAFVWLGFVVVTIFSTTDWGRTCFEMIKSSSFLSVLYASNIFFLL